jgi:phosphatidylglycerophosphatase A
MNTFGRRVVLFFVTGAGAGYFPRMPGTIGTLVAIPFSLALNGIAVSKDPQLIVVDEIVGFLVANFLAPPRLTALVWSFALFRFFDITKVFPTNRLEQLPGGVGIVLDDIMAGLYALIGLRLLLMLGWA